MSGQQVGTVVGGVVGAVIGFYAGGNVVLGAQIGMSVGGMVGGAVDPTKIYGPHIGDGQAQSATDGAAISWVMGTMWVAGTIVDVGTRQEFPVKQSGGKGSGTEQINYEAHQNFRILVCESDAIKDSSIKQVLMIEQDGKIVYDVRPGSTMLADSAKYAARNFLTYYGDENQLPTAADEAAHGVGNAPAYRGVLCVFFTQFNVTAVGDRIPSFRFLVASKTLPPATENITIDVQPGNEDPGNGYIYCGYYDTALPQGIGGTVTFSEFPQSNTLRYVFCYLTGTVVEGNTSLNHSLAGDAVLPNTFFDTGWLAANQDWEDEALSPQNGEKDQPPSSIQIYSDWLAANPLPTTVSLPPNATGIRMYRFSWGGTTPPDPCPVAVTMPSGDADSIDLADMVQAICNRGGIDASLIDVTALAGTTVLGYSIAKQMNAVDALGPLLGAYFAYASEYDGKINFKFYGADAVMTIDEADILAENDANDGNVTANLRNNATEFPKRIVGRYYDEAQNYMPVTVTETRRAQGVTATGDLAFDIPVVMAADQAQQTVHKALKVAYAQLEGTIEFSVPFAGTENVYLSLVAGDPVIFRGKRWIVTEPIISNGYIKLTLQNDRQSAYTSVVQAIPGLTPTPPQSIYSGPTTLYPMNLPSLRPQDTYGVYLAAASTTGSTSWRGCTVQVSYDGQVSWQNALTITEGSTLGTVTTAEPSGGEPLTVNVDGTGDLESITTDQLAARMNAFALVNGETAEIGQFQTAALQEDGTYQLTTISRGLLGTTETPATAGQPFTMLDSVYFLPIDISFKGKTLYFRAVGFGENAEDQQVVSMVYNHDTDVIIDGGTPGDGLPQPGGS